MKSIPYLVFQTCCGCQERLENKYRNRNVRRVGERNIEKIKAFFENNVININDYICNRCRIRVSKNMNYLIRPNDLINSSQSTNKDLVLSSSESNENNQNVQVLNMQKDSKNIVSTKKTDKTFTKTIELPTALSTHVHCFLCNNFKSLHTVKPESIFYAYSHHGIVIKNHARSCDNHLDSNGLIKVDEFKSMKTRIEIYDKNAINISDTCVSLVQKIQHQLQYSSGIFDKFKDMASLDEALCMKITGWTKPQFADFSRYITCVRGTSGRTKEQMIAIYRYWLFKGIDQCSLAMFKSNTNQQQISHYLAQIRVAINKDFVPLFLGANKGKPFFLKHNTDSVKILHEMEDEALAIVVDGTYTRLEKSSNNHFQYISYSMQKLHNLVKPFIMCRWLFHRLLWTFSSVNDAQIFRYILSTDEDLKLLFTPKDKIIMFLDRGNVSYYSCWQSSLIFS